MLYNTPYLRYLGFPDDSVVSKEPACHCRRSRFHPWVRMIPWRRKWQPTEVFLPEKSPWTEEPGRLHGVAKELDMT